MIAVIVRPIHMTACTCNEQVTEMERERWLAVASGWAGGSLFVDTRQWAHYVAFLCSQVNQFSIATAIDYAQLIGGKNMCCLLFSSGTFPKNETVTVTGTVPQLANRCRSYRTLE